MTPESNREPDGAAEIDYRFLAENCADVLCSIGADHVIHYVSPSCLEILGWDPAEMIAKDLRQFIFSDDLPALEDLEVGKPPDGVAYTHARLRFLRKDQTFLWISVNARCICDSATGEPRQYVFCMRDITGRTVLEEKLSALAMTDALTGLWNRRAFDQALRREWKRTFRKESDLSLLLLDLDHFKPLNDQYGHPLGDECLAAVAAAISDTVRATDVVCRWGGDEVAIILPATDQAGALKAAEKIRCAIEALRFRAKKNSGESVSVTASIGVATGQAAPDGTLPAPQDLLLAADRALYQAKHEGHNRVALAAGIAARGMEMAEAVATMAISDVKRGQEASSQHAKDGLVREGQPDGIDGL
jgi:diguanylate cyclase (GGDEF)-like protein/PAS domain S-box-containing protein